MEILSINALIIKGKVDVFCLRHNAKNARKINEKLLLKIIHQNSNTEYGKKYSFDKIHSIDDYQKIVPLSTYEDYDPYIDKIFYDNKSNVLTKAKIIGFSKSSGSIGKPKIIPLTNPAIRIYTKYTVTRFLALADSFWKRNGKKCKPGRGISGLPRFIDCSPHGLLFTNVADVAAQKYGFIYPYILNLPIRQQFLHDDIDNKYAQARFGLEDRNTLYMFSVFSKTIAELIEYIRDNWKMLVEDIELGTINENIMADENVRKRLLKQLRPNPKRASELRCEFEKGFDETIVSRLWPNMSVISSIGTSPTFEPFTETILKYTKGIVFDYSIYGASEGLYAAANKCNEKGQLMLPDSCFYEFIEADSDDETQILTLDQLEVGKEYEIIVTNQMGFYRYRIKDLIRVLAYEGDCPVVNFTYRKGQLLNVTGEKTTYEQMTEAIKRLSKLSGINIVNWSTFVERGEIRYRYSIAIETGGDKSLEKYSEQFEEILRDVNTSYKFYEKSDLIEPPVIYIQKPGSHDEWRDYKIRQGASPAQVKPVYLLDTDEKKNFFLSRLL